MRKSTPYIRCCIANERLEKIQLSKEKTRGPRITVMSGCCGWVLATTTVGTASVHTWATKLYKLMLISYNSFPPGSVIVLHKFVEHEVS